VRRVAFRPVAKWHVHLGLPGVTLPLARRRAMGVRMVLDRSADVFLTSTIAGGTGRRQTQRGGPR